MRTLITSFLMLTLIIGLSNAQIIHVPGDQPSIQAGINAAENGDTVLVADSTYIENINFKGKAITVASHFLVDGDTSHISKTIIDGSQPNHSDTASVVSMVSGEDTTSVLCGFTVTGGNGTYFEGTYFTDDNKKFLGGGGLFIFHSGGKIERNIFRDNHMTDREGIYYSGAVIAALVYDNHTAIIRNNIIRNNTYNGNAQGMAGISINGAKLIVEGNIISDNIANSQTEVAGGIAYRCGPDLDIIPEVIINNNAIVGNILYPGTNGSFGGGIRLYGNHLPLNIKVYNNLICDNQVLDGYAGGIWIAATERAVVFNNTIVNNKAGQPGKQLMLDGFDALHGGSKVMLYNNIIGSDTDDGISDISIDEYENLILIARYNNIKGGWEGEGNIPFDPRFKSDSFDLSDSSMCIGRGVDSVEIEGTWYFAPGRDYHGNVRPDTIADHLVDMGAIESGYPKYIPVIFDQWFTVDENSTVAGEIYLDTSKWESDSIIYTIIGGNPYPTIFKIDSSTREILVLYPDSLDYEDTCCHHLTIRAEHDVSSGTTTDFGEIYITLNNINDNAPIFNESIYIYSIPKNSPATTPVGEVSAEDPDGDIIYYEILDGNVNNTFRISKPLGTISVANADSLDGSIPEFNLRIVVKELYGPHSDTALVLINIITSVKVYYDPNMVSIYPNPSKNIVTVHTGTFGMSTVEIISLNGQKLYSRKFSSNTINIDLSSFQKGVYFITVRSKDYVRTEKIIKL